MSPKSASLHMWVEASELLDRAERLHRRFFELGHGVPQHCWEPPCDVVETDEGVFVEVALPGVDPEQLEAGFVAGGLLVAGERRPPPAGRQTVVRRLEIPYGRFERHIPLPAGSYELVGRELVNGCFKLALRKIA